jgi:hypothetical protein
MKLAGRVGIRGAGGLQFWASDSQEERECGGQKEGWCVGGVSQLENSRVEEGD